MWHCRSASSLSEALFLPLLLPDSQHPTFPQPSDYALSACLSTHETTSTKWSPHSFNINWDGIFVNLYSGKNQTDPLILVPSLREFILYRWIARITVWCKATTTTQKDKERKKKRKQTKTKANRQREREETANLRSLKSNTYKWSYTVWPRMLTHTHAVKLRKSVYASLVVVLLLVNGFEIKWQTPLSV